MFKDRGNTIIIVVTVLCIGSLMCIVLGLGRVGQFFNPGAAYARTGRRAPTFSLLTPDNDLVELEEYRGRPVLINFWATWCGPCVEEMPRIQKRYLDNIATLVVLAVNECEDRNDVVDFVDSHNLIIPVLLDEGCLVGTGKYYVNAYPTSFFIDAEGVIQAVFIGGMTDKVLDNNLSLIGVGK